MILRLKYFFYWLLTANERHCYEMGKIKGMHCEGFRSDELGGRIYKYIPGLNPIKDF